MATNPDLSNELSTKKSNIVIRRARLEDTSAIHSIVLNTPSLSHNSDSTYMLFPAHFSDTCLVVLENTEVIGFLISYIEQNTPATLFLWQVGVHSDAQGKGI